MARLQLQRSSTYKFKPDDDADRFNSEVELFQNFRAKLKLMYYKSFGTLHPYLVVIT